MKILNVIMSWINSQELADVANKMGVEIEVGRRCSTSDHLCEQCVGEHIDAGDTVTVVGDSDEKNCASCGTRHWWRSPN